MPTPGLRLPKFHSPSIVRNGRITYILSQHHSDENETECGILCHLKLDGDRRHAQADF